LRPGRARHRAGPVGEVRSRYTRAAHRSHRLLTGARALLDACTRLAFSRTLWFALLALSTLLPTGPLP